MKHLLRLILFSLSVFNTDSNLHAQTTLTQANSGLRSGDQFLVHEFNSISSTAHSYAQNSPGNQTWVFNQLPVDGLRTALVKSRVNAPYASDFPGANAVLDFQNTVFLPHALSYIENTTGYAKEVATVYPNPARIIEFTNPIERLRFPFTFNDTYTDTFSGDYVHNGDSCVRFGNITVTADGYGTIITPAGTFNNVIRIKTLEFANDSCPPNLSNLRTSQSTITYDWYAPGIHFPVFRVLEHHEMLAIFWAGFYLDINALATKEEEASLLNFQIFPNPAEEEVTLQYQLKNAFTVKLSLVNALGQVVKNLEIAQQSPGTYSEKIKLNDYPKGIYHIRMQTEDNVATRKLIIR